MRVALLALTALLAFAPGAAAADPRVLVFTKTTGFRHEAIPDAVRMLQDLGRAHGFSVTATEQEAMFNPRDLRRFRVVVFALTTGDVLGPQGQDALEDFVRAGGGWLGVHSAADTEYGWPFYGTLLAGAWFKSHPAPYGTNLIVEARGHPATRHLGARWARFDEWYEFQANPRTRARVLLRIPGDDDHPVAWCRPVGRGVSFYTGLGHTRESYAEPKFQRHVLGGLRTVLERRRAACRVKSDK